MGQKVIIRFWWESGLLSASRNHLTNFCIRFVQYAKCNVLYIEVQARGSPTT